MVLEFYDIYRNYNGYNITMKRYLILDGLMKKWKLIGLCFEDFIKAYA